ncbi:acyl carrier protein [Peribacillus simplex]|uniref:acyl carrier protein n=1 Tax=Peribacillus simplex TaxID=1478 RepID=UPI0019224BCD|nr:acyl carrier protein [Peribacillus simplex]MBD8591209.1 acyl carrier protein [Peribacillus simplex]
MAIELIQQKVLRLLVEYFNEDIEDLLMELEEYDDIEIDSIYFIEMIPFLEAEYGITIKSQNIHDTANRSFNAFCLLIEDLIT